MGIKVVHDEDKPVKLYGVVTDLRVERDFTLLARAKDDLEGVTFETLAGHIKALHDDLLSKLEHPRELLGVGVEVASHVHDGAVIGASHLGMSSGEPFDLLTPLQELLGDVPVVIDNDVNVLAVRQTYRPQAERHVAVVAVLHDGVGGSLIIDGHVYRGGGGMAAEPGHHTVTNLSLPPLEERSDDGPAQRFEDACHCGRIGHVDCYAVPSRLEAELGSPIPEAGCQSARDPSGQLTRAARNFRAGGEALGQGIASMLNTVNPSHLVLILPGDLARADPFTDHISNPKGPDDIIGRAEPGTAAAQYLEGVEAAVTAYSFSTAAHDARNPRTGRRQLTVLIMDPEETEEQGAVCAAIRVLDSFVLHALERDRCPELTHGSRPLAEVS